MAKTQHRYPKDFINFIRSLKIDPDNEVIENVIDQKSPYVSTYYTPHKQVSELGRQVLNEINKNNIRTTTQKPEAPSLSSKTFYGDILKHYPSLKTLFKIVFLESFALIYVEDENNNFEEYINAEDLEHLRETVKYLIDVIGEDPRHTNVILYLHDVDQIIGRVTKQYRMQLGGN